MGGPVLSSLNETIMRIIPDGKLLTFYGMTEICHTISSSKSNDLAENPNNVGYLAQNIQIKIINIETNERCGIGEEGEIYVKISIPIMGYFENDEANRAAFDVEGFFITGDIGFFDETGRLFVTARKSEIFKSRGFFVSPALLEDIITRDHAVKEACVVNVFDEEISSDLPAAVVVKNERSTITEDYVYSLIAGKETDWFSKPKIIFS